MTSLGAVSVTMSFQLAISSDLPIKLYPECRVGDITSVGQLVLASLGARLHPNW